MADRGRDNLWAPWRIGFMQTLTHRDTREDPAGCFFCEAARDTQARDPDPHLLLHRGAHAVLLMNRYPYVNGHILVAPCRHVADLDDLEPEECHALMDGLQLAARALRRGMNAQGYNVGFNVGRCAGAALPGHVHAHVVPRWHGDTNFMEVLGGVKVIPQALEDSYATLLETVRELLRATP